MVFNRHPKFFSSFIANKIVFTLIGSFLVLFFGFVISKILPKLFDKKPALLINELGIFDNSNVMSVGQIFWSDIKEIKMLQGVDNKLIKVIVKNPLEYIEKVKPTLNRSTLNDFYLKYETPIIISELLLNTNFEKLYQILNEKMEFYNLEIKKT